MKLLQDLIRSGRTAEARARLRDLTAGATTYGEWAALGRAHARLAAVDPEGGGRPLRVAVLGVGTTDLIAPALTLALDAWGFRAELLRADFNTWAREMLDPDSATARFKPEVALVVNSPMSLPARPAPFASDADAEAAVAAVVDYWLDLCRALHAAAPCEIILDNYHLLTPGPNGNLGTRLPWDLNAFVRKVNAALAARAPAWMHVHDVDLLASRDGVDRWFDARGWYEAKLPMAARAVPAYARHVAGIIGALYGRTAKCLVLDLDNTLWGGIVGDDGPDGIRIGQGDPVGEAHLALQEYLAGLRQRGLLLAVCSKNDERNALAPFERRPEMRLKREDLVAFKANWDPKPDNLRAIARELNLGLDALLFVDDNPREREHVRQQTPDVRVVELSDDPAQYPALIDATGWVQVARIASDDLARTDQYRANQVRETIRQSAADYGAYLTSLDQVGVIGPFVDRHLDRIAQLVNKTNQFNLTTRRQTRADVEQEMSDPARLTAYVRLKDRFGDNGLISVLSGRQEGDTLVIDQWLMSCRVLGRSVEQLLLNWLAEQARARGVRALAGAYRPTAKNGLVRQHYETLGFEPIEGDGTEATHWRLELGAFTPRECWIRVVDDY